MSSPEIQSGGIGVDPNVDVIRPIVHERLRAVEREHELRVVFACESGSRAWGFASNDSDFDVRFIYVRPPQTYLMLNPPKDAFDLHGDDDYDLAGWDIRKATELMRKSNPPLLEWIDSPIIYECDQAIATRLTELRDIYFDPKKSAYHYHSLASGIWGKFLKDNADPIRKKYLYALRPLACVLYIEQHGKQPPTRFESVLAGIHLDDPVRGAIGRLIENKKSNREIGTGPADPILNQWICDTLAHAECIAEALEPSKVSNKNLDQLIAFAVLGASRSNGELA